MSTKVQLQTERLLLRVYEESDIPAIVALLGTREVAAMTLRIPHPYSETDAREYLQRLNSAPVPTSFGIFDRNTEELYGGMGLMLDEQHSKAEIGYWIGLPFWGRGYATEAAREVVRYGFEDLKLNRIFAGVYGGNNASMRILAKLGFKHEGTLRQHYLKWGQFLDSECYGLLRSEWSAA